MYGRNTDSSRQYYGHRRVMTTTHVDSPRTVVRKYNYHQQGPVPHGHIFVFGSNLAGRHGRGAALDALKLHGAKLGQGVGPQGTSYALPTKGKTLKSLSLDEIACHVQNFLDYARQHPELTFYVTRVGCGLAGYADIHIAPLFYGAPTNCVFPYGWWSLLELSPE